MALSRIRGNQQVQDLSITNAQISLPDGNNLKGILLTKIEDGSLLVKSDGTVPFSVPVSGATPTLGTHFATKDYVDSTSQGLDVKRSVRAVARSNVTMSGTQTIDDVPLVDNDRVLVSNQTNPVENGIYVVHAGAWNRAADATTNASVTPGLFTFIEEGTQFKSTGWVLASVGPTTLGSTALPFVQFSAAGTTQGGAGLVKNGSFIDIVSANGGIIVNADSITLTIDGPTLTIGPNGLKLSNIGEAQLLIGSPDGSVVPRTVSGDATINSNGVLTLTPGSVDGNTIADSSVVLQKLEVAGQGGQVILSAVSGVPTYTTISGDATLSASGVLTLTATSVGTNEIEDESVIASKIAPNAVTQVKLAIDSVSNSKILNGAVTENKLGAASVSLPKMATIPAGQIIMGSAAGNVYVTLSGDVTVTEAGVVSINAATVVRVQDIVKNEVPTGATNGVNLEYTLAFTPKAGTVDVFVNGILQEAGAGADYQIVNKTVAMLYPLSSTDKIRVSYFK